MEILHPDLLGFRGGNYNLLSDLIRSDISEVIISIHRSGTLFCSAYLWNCFAAVTDFSIMDEALLILNRSATVSRSAFDMF